MSRMRDGRLDHSRARHECVTIVRVVNINASRYRDSHPTSVKCDRIWENPPYGIFCEN